jgi:hypothetical protein
MQRYKLVSETSETLSDSFYILKITVGNTRHSAFVMLSGVSNVRVLILRIFIPAVRTYEDTFNGKLDIYESSYQILTYDLELIESLEPHGRNPRRDRIEEGYKESFEWLWNQDKSGPGFVDWLQGDDPFFWISGKPGSGKSTIMRQSLDDPRTLEYLSSKKDQPVRVASFFFHELGSDEEQNLLGFLHGILAQLLTTFEELAPYVVPIFKRLKHSGRPKNQLSIWTQQELILTLKHIFKQESKVGCICLFIDGLDECAGSHRDQLDFLLPWIKSANRTKLSLKVCLASRPLVEIEHRLSRFPGSKFMSGLSQTLQLLRPAD